MAKWAFDPTHSRVAFTVRHMMFAKVHGTFNAWSGTIELPETGFADGQVSVEIDVASIDTQNEQRDGHLKSPDFFDAAKFPKLTFAGTKVEGAGNEFKLHGNLTIRGVTKPVVLAVEDAGSGKDPWGNLRRGFSAHGKLDRAEFGLTWNQALETGGVIVGNEVTLSIDVQVVKQG